MRQKDSSDTKFESIYISFMQSTFCVWYQLRYNVHSHHYHYIVWCWSLITGTRWHIWPGNHDDVIKWKNNPRYWPFGREFTGQRWIPLTKAELWCFLWSVPEKRLSKQSRRRWIETPSCSLWRHCNNEYASEIIGSGNGLWHVCHQAITWTSADLSSTGLFGTKFSER